MRSLVLSSTLAVVLLGLSMPAVADCDAACKTNQFKNGWCDKCKVAYFDGVRIASQKLFNTLAGKPVDPEATKCEGCKTAIAKDGICDHCHVGFAHKTAYKSMVAYQLARGTATDPATITCNGCKGYTKDHGWCDKCSAGVVGPCVFKDKTAYNEGVEAREQLVAAVKMADKCEGCAVAMVTDGTCSSCNITYKDGKPTKEKP